MITICYDRHRCKIADVAELVDALDLGSSVFGREGSSPFIRIFLCGSGLMAYTVMSEATANKFYFVQNLDRRGMLRSHFLKSTGCICNPIIGAVKSVGKKNSSLIPLVLIFL